MIDLYKLIALDLDGTLLNDKKTISKENLYTIGRLIDRGHTVLIATGRGYFDAKNLVKDMDKNLTILANNGNIIRNSIDEKTFFTNYMPSESVRDIFSIGKEYDLKPIVHVDYYSDGIDMVIDDDAINDDKGVNSYISGHSNRFKFMDKKSIVTLDKILVVVYLGDRDVLNEFNQNIIEEFPDRYSSHILENIQSAEGMFEIMGPSRSKWTSILEYCKKFGIHPDDIIAIGDDNNDIEMIKKAGLGISMKNGNKSVKKVSDIITDFDNNDSGVARILEKILY